jgi:ABC-type nitrate/sulfonate/bicarbonate transport system substrate-binding protein
MSNKTISIGYIALCDALPLIAAQELGLFEKNHLEVNLHAEVSWSNIRDKLNIGIFDAAHMLAPMLFATHMGLSGVSNPMSTAFAFGMNGNAVTVSNDLFKQINNTYTAKIAGSSAQALAEVIKKRAAKGLAPLTLATVFPFSCHLYQLHDWLGAAGINIHEDIKLCILPPEQMVEHLQKKRIDGFCVGEPWNSYAVSQELGQILATSVEIWGNSPEKVLAVSQKWAKRYEEQHQLIVQSLVQAAEWLEYHREETATLLAKSHLMPLHMHNYSKALCNGVHSGIEHHFISPNDLIIFNHKNANIPQQYHARFILKKMQSLGHIKNNIDIDSLASQCYSTELHLRFVEETINIDTPSL